MCCTRCESGKEPESSMQKKRWRSKEVEILYSQWESQIEQSKSMRENSFWEYPPKPRIVRNEEKNKKFFKASQMNYILQHHFKMTQHGMMRKLTVTSGLLQEISFIAIMWNPESNCTCREKNHFLFQWNTLTLPEHTHPWMYCWRKYWRLLETWMEKKNCQMHGRMYMVREETYLSSRQCMARYVETCLMRRKWKQNKDGLSRNQARQCQTIERNILPNDEEFKLTIKAARRKLEVPMPAAMPCDILIKGSGERQCNIGKRKTKYARVVGADESTRPRLEGAGHKSHQVHITAKRMNSITHYSLVHKFIPMPQALKIPEAKAAVRTNVKNWRKSQHGSWRKLETRKTWSMKQGTRENSSFCVNGGSLSS